MCGSAPSEPSKSITIDAKDFYAVMQVPIVDINNKASARCFEHIAALRVAL